MNRDLFDGALDVVLKSGFITRVAVEEHCGNSNQNNNKKKAMTTLFCCGSATTSDVKALLRERFHHQDTEIRLRDKTSGRHVVGNFCRDPDPSCATCLTCETVSVDPHLSGLLQVVGMGEEKERDRMMSRMMSPRLARQCPGNHALTATNYGHGGLFDVVCDKCNENLQSEDNWYGCRVCNFDLCSACHDGDVGAETIMMSRQQQQQQQQQQGTGGNTNNNNNNNNNNPYDEVAHIAQQLGTRYAKLVCNRWLHRRRPNSFWLIWEHTNWGWVSPSTFTKNKSILTNQDIEDYRLSRDQLLLAPGVRLVISLSEDLKAMVVVNDNNSNDTNSNENQDEDNDDDSSEERHAKKIRTDNHQSTTTATATATATANDTTSSSSLLLPGETDEILPNGATADELEEYAKKICDDEPTWTKVKERLEMKLAAAGWNWDRTSLFHDVMLQLESLELGKVSYKLTAVAGRNWQQVRM